MEICYNHDGGEGLSTSVFLSAFRRFICLRGIQSAIIYADQGTNFMGAIQKIQITNKEWNDIVTREINLITARKLEWISNCPTATHMNGCTERMVRWARRALDASVNYNISEFYPIEWITYLYEVVYLINSRPLFPFNSLDEKGYITPNSILFGHNIYVPQYVNVPNTSPRHQVEYIQKYIQIFWENYVRYMPQILAVHNKWFDVQGNLQIGDYIILRKDGFKSMLPRALWDVAVIIKTYPGQDGLVRKVRVKTRNGEYDRPIHKMCLIATQQELKDNKVNNPDPNLLCNHISLC